MFTLGLTGGICSGKSAAGTWFSSHGIAVLDADEVSRQVVRPGTRALEQIASKFGSDVIDAKGSLRRDLMRQIVFADPSLRSWLESLIHPLVRKEMRQFVESCTTPYCILVVPLLAETDFRFMMDRILVIDVAPQTQRERLRHRDGMNETQIDAILDAQASREARLAIADDVIENSGDWSEFHQKLQLLHQMYLELANVG